MDPVARAVLLSWNFDPWVILPLIATGAVYLRGWWILNTKLPGRLSCFQLAAFQSGMISILLALSSPIDTFAGLLLFVHMIQHILLTMVAPPLLLLGAPMLPLLRGLPRDAFSGVVAPLLRAPALRHLGDFLVRPPTALILFSLATIAWHVPVLYELALRSEFWHQIEHICFFGTGLLFWWPVLEPWPSRPHWSGWLMILYLLAADLVNTAVSAVLCFAERVLYPTYAAVPTLWGISALADQAAAGAIMWVAGSLAFLLPVGWILSRLLEPSLVSPSITTAATNRTRRGARRVGALRSRILVPAFLLISWHMFEPSPALSHHAGVVQFKQNAAPFVITLFSESSPLHEGVAELAVLVQTAENEPVLDAEVGIELENGQRQRVQTVATRADSSNNLLYGTEIVVPAPGVWTVTVRVRHEERVANVTGKLVVEAASTRSTGWLYLLASAGALAAAWVAWRRRDSWRKARNQQCYGKTTKTTDY